MRLTLLNPLRLFVNNNLKYIPKLFNRRRFCSDMDGDAILLSKVVAELDAYADPKLAESWDNVGLLIEPKSPHCVSKIFLTNDLTTPVMEEALKFKTNLIISYHPPIFASLKRIGQSSWKDKIIASCMENKIAVYSPHTAWDAAEGALGDSLASAFSEYSESVSAIIPAAGGREQYFYDIMTNKNNLDCLIMKYQAQIICSMECGVVGKEVYRVVTTENVAQEIAGLQETIVTQVKQIPKKTPSTKGMGRIVKLKEPGITLKECVEVMKTYTGLKRLRLVTGLGHDKEAMIKTVALVAGSGGSVLKSVTVDLFVTGEMFHHDLLNASENNTSVILTNHSDSERPFLNKFKSYLSEKFPNLEIAVSSTDKDPVQTV